jgi:hypothetical protein
MMKEFAQDSVSYYVGYQSRFSVRMGILKKKYIHPEARRGEEGG